MGHVQSPSLSIWMFFPLGPCPYKFMIKPSKSQTHLGQAWLPGYQRSFREFVWQLGRIELAFHPREHLHDLLFALSKLLGIRLKSHSVPRIWQPVTSNDQILDTHFSTATVFCLCLDPAEGLFGGAGIQLKWQPSNLEVQVLAPWETVADLLCWQILVGEHCWNDFGVNLWVIYLNMFQTSIEVRKWKRNIKQNGWFKTSMIDFCYKWALYFWKQTLLHTCPSTLVRIYTSIIFVHITIYVMTYYRLEICKIIQLPRE